MNNRQTMEGEMKGLVKNTLMFRFPDGVTGPSARLAKIFDAEKFTMFEFTCSNTHMART